MHGAKQIAFILVVASIAACADNNSALTSPRIAAAGATRTVASSGPVTVDVVSTLYDLGVAGNSLITESDDYNGSGFATYSPIAGVHNSLTSQVTSDGGWKLYIGNQTVRKLHLLLADAGLPFANGYYYSSVEMGSRCFDQAGNQLNIQLLSPGLSYDNCSLIVDFDIGTKHPTTYKLAMGPAFANTGRASISCSATDGTYCTSWTVVPNDTVSNAHIAILTSGSGTTSLDGKSYTNSYSVTATKQ